VADPALAETTIGSPSVGDTALLAALIGGRDARARGTALLRDEDLVGLARRGPVELVQRFGLGHAGALRIACAFELGRRVERRARAPRPAMRSAERVFAWVAPELRGLARERFLALLLDGKHRLVRTCLVSEGTLTTSLVHPREVFRPAIADAAAAVICVHNHPSGDPEPSREDLEVTRRLRRAGELLQIPLLDHVIAGDGRYVSLRTRLGF